MNKLSKAVVYNNRDVKSEGLYQAAQVVEPKSCSIFIQHKISEPIWAFNRNKTL